MLHSMTENEYISSTDGIKEALWLRSLLSEIFRCFKDLTILFSDNQAVTALVRNHQYRTRAKHIDMRYHWLLSRAPCALYIVPCILPKWLPTSSQSCCRL
jgi:hypothetical protein